VKKRERKVPERKWVLPSPSFFSFFGHPSFATRRLGGVFIFGRLFLTVILTLR
jgi:hypothetical protein